MIVQKHRGGNICKDPKYLHQLPKNTKCHSADAYPRLKSDAQDYIFFLNGQKIAIYRIALLPLPLGHQTEFTIFSHAQFKGRWNFWFS